MRYLTGLMILLSSTAAMADDTQLKQWEKMDRCSDAAFTVVAILEESAEAYK
ncbi:hypothetical protein PFWH6_3529 [Pseudomonas fluorescens WH6]|nr:hypothetical protein PFWH6_3529 [Pseudomonas fluorescens WH6]